MSNPEVNWRNQAIRSGTPFTLKRLFSPVLPLAVSPSPFSIACVFRARPLSRTPLVERPPRPHAERRLITDQLMALTHSLWGGPIFPALSITPSDKCEG